MEGNWEAKVIFSPGRIVNNVYLSRRRRGTGGVREFMVGANTIVAVTPDKPRKDEELIFAALDEDQLHALQEAITAHGIKSPEASYTQGKLEATVKHLEDTRTLLSLNVPKLAKPIISNEEKQ